VRIQSSHHHADRGLDAYFSPPEAAASLLHIEEEYLPKCIWEPAAGDGAIVRPLQDAGFTVIASDIVDYGLHDCTVVDYLKAKPIREIQGVVTNPPYKLAVQFAEKALREVPYLALLLRTNFLESTARLPFFHRHQPARIWISSRRLPMMHRHGRKGLAHLAIPASLGSSGMNGLSKSALLTGSIGSASRRRRARRISSEPLKRSCASSLSAPSHGGAPSGKEKPKLKVFGLGTPALCVLVRKPKFKGSPLCGRGADFDNS
jgi:hypothetical protein